MYNPDMLSKNIVTLAKLHMPLENIWMDIETFHKSWDREKKLYNLSISTFKQDTRNSLNKINFYKSILAIMDASGFGTFGPNKTSFNFGIVNFIINTANYIENLTHNDIKAIETLSNNKSFEQLFQNWIDKKLDEHQQKNEILSAYKKIKQSIPNFPELYPTALDTLLSQKQSPITR